MAIVAVAAAATPALADKRQDKARAAAMTLTPEHFRSLVTLKDDSLDTVATLSTERGYQEKTGLLKIVWNDNFLRAFIDKKTGLTKYQVYQRIAYDGDWRFYRTANYETPDGPESVTVTDISKDVLSCSRYSGCSHDETFGFDVPETLLRTIAAGYQPGVAVAWRFKYSSRSGQDWPDGMLPAEIVGLLGAVDQYRSAHGLPVPAAGAASPPAPIASPIIVAKGPAFGFDVDMVSEGAYVKSVWFGSPAAAAGLTAGMVISSVGKASAKGITYADFAKLVANTGPVLEANVIGKGPVKILRSKP